MIAADRRSASTNTRALPTASAGSHRDACRSGDRPRPRRPRPRRDRQGNGLAGFSATSTLEPSVGNKRFRDGRADCRRGFGVPIGLSQTQPFAAGGLAAGRTAVSRRAAGGAQFDWPAASGVCAFRDVGHERPVFRDGSGDSCQGRRVDNVTETGLASGQKACRQASALPEAGNTHELWRADRPGIPRS